MWTLFILSGTMWNSFPALATPSPCFPLTTILTLVHIRSTSLITGVRATVGVIRTVALCADLSTWRSFVPSPTTAYSPAYHVDASSADGNVPPLQLPPLIFCFNSHSIWNCLNCQQTLRTISTCTPSGQIWLAEEGFSHPSIPSSASRMVQTGLILDDIVTVLEVTGRGRGMYQHLQFPRQSDHYFWRPLGSSCGENSVSNSFSFLPIVIYISSMYSLGCSNTVY
jgi:hypothetical protein